MRQPGAASTQANSQEDYNRALQMVTDLGKQPGVVNWAAPIGLAPFIGIYYYLIKLYVMDGHTTGPLSL